MRIFSMVVLFVLVFALPAMAIFCHQCGKTVPDAAKFCPACGTRQDAGAAAKPTTRAVKPATTPATPVAPAAPAGANRYAGGVYRCKTDLYVYEKRGDEHNVLKKNLFFKPRRYRIKAGWKFRVLEEVGDSYLVESVLEAGVSLQRGWVTEAELKLRTDWEKK